MNDELTALFVMLGQTAERTVQQLPDVVPGQPLLLSPTHDLALVLPESVRTATSASETYKLLFVFEAYLRNLVVDVLSKDQSRPWWDGVPQDVQEEVAKLEETEEAKSWMALGSRDKSALMTYPQLLRVIDQCWKQGFEDLMRDKALIQEARLITHLRNTICHMSDISPEEQERVRQTIRDWFRMVSP